ncbi:hypothetical protein EDB85DRAFT_2024026 [Lactarius pseudohatsudake]|nr:hypothetical protein EDB85DRAFT_2024026 [Lactarius pseudohatsudake]
MTRRIRSEVDIAARLIGRSFGALVVKKLAQDIGSRTDRGLRVNDSEAELSCLAAILGTTNAEVATWLSQPGTIDGHLGRRTSVVGSSGNIPNDARHSHHGGPSGFTEYRAATRSGSHFPRRIPTHSDFEFLIGQWTWDFKLQVGSLTDTVPLIYHLSYHRTRA